MSQPQYVPLNYQQHKDLKVSQGPDLSKFQGNNLLPALVHEFVSLACDYPLVFVKNEQNGEFVPIALTGVEEGQNLYYQDGQWQSTFLPSSVSNDPFMLARQGEDSEDFFLCIDEKSGSLSKDNGQPLFDSEGNRSDYLNQRVEQLSQVEGRRIQTTDFVNTLKKHELLIPQGLKLSIGSESRNITGINLVDENKLNELPQDVWLELKDKGYLPAIYAHLISLHQVRRLSSLYLKQQKAA